MPDQKEKAVGLALSRAFALVSWYAPEQKEPLTCSQGEEEEPELFPVPGQVGTLLFEEDEGSVSPDGHSGLKALTDFLEQLLLKVTPEGAFSTLRVMVTLPTLRRGIENILPEALMTLGIERKNIYLQDYLSSFYYYTVNQKKELWNGDVALLEYEAPEMIGYVLHIDHSKTPALVTVEKAASVAVREELFADRSSEGKNKEKDRLLFELLKKVFERRNVVTSYLVGEYYDGSWAVRSFQYLCQHRHAFRGGNLYTKGACYAAMARAGMVRMPEMLFLGSHMIRENVGMNMRINGKEAYYPIVSAGVNWYEAHHECEMIPDSETSITLLTRPMTGGKEVQRVLRLTGFPERKNRATRIRLTVYFTSANCAVVEAEDMGFGGFYAPEDLHWKREIRFEDAEMEAEGEL